MYKFFILSLIFLFPFHSFASTLLDSNTSGINADSFEQNGVGDHTQQGQTFTTPNDGVSYTLDSISFKLARAGSYTGTSRVKIFAHTGTYGSTGKPTGSVLATSDNYDPSTYGTTASDITFIFSGAERITLSPNTHYSIYVESPTGNGDNNIIYLLVYRSSSDVHSGNHFYSDDNASTWTTVSANDLIFSVYGVTGGGGGGTATTTPQSTNIMLTMEIILLILGIMFLFFGIPWATDSLIKRIPINPWKL